MGHLSSFLEAMGDAFKASLVTDEMLVDRTNRLVDNIEVGADGEADGWSAVAILEAWLMAARWL